MKLKGRTVDAMCRELELLAPEAKSEIIETVYFGGGTPSLLSEEELSALFATIRKFYRVAESAEITLEANPDDFSPEILNHWKKEGINRLSIGVQSFLNRDLTYMERIHDAGQAERVIRMSQQADIKNLTIDLIYGTPGLSQEEWKLNLEKAVMLGVPHISAYALTVEENTPLFHRIRRKQKNAPDENLTADQFLFMADFLEKAGYIQYEVSNFALPGMESRHNSAYWENKPYLGIGPSAHSYRGNRRRMNIANNARYVAAMEEGKNDYFTEEILTGDDEYNEFLLTRLRTRKGLNREDFSARFSPGEWLSLLEELEEIPAEYLVIEEDGIHLSREGLLHADGIAAELFR